MWFPGKQALASVLRGFLRAPCPLCQRPAVSVFCLDCSRQLQACQLAAVPAAASVDLPVIAWGTYGGTLKQAIHALKYRGCPEIADVLGQQLGEQWQTQHAAQFSSPGRLQVVPIPLHPERLRHRGYNQAGLIAQSFCRTTGLPCLNQGLRRVRATVAQHQLGLQTRQQNLQNAFQIGIDWQPRHRSASVLLLDDIYTTGATVQAATAVFRRAGIPVVGCVIVARATLRRPGATKAVG